MDTNKSKVDVSVSMLNNSRVEFVLVSSIVIMHRYILNKQTYLERLAVDHINTFEMKDIDMIK